VVTRGFTPKTRSGGAMPRPSTEAAAASLWAAIDAESELRHHTLARVGQVAAMVGMCLVPIVFWRWGPTVGASGAIIAIACFAWFTVRRLASGDSAIERALQSISPVLILVFPFALLFVVMRAKGVEAAFASWIPAEVIIAFIFFSMLHMRPAVPFVIGTGAAAAYMGFYLYARATWVDAEVSPFFRDPSMHYLRTGTFFFCGIAAARSTMAIRKMLSRASRRARAADLFGKYRIEEKVADGGMGSVYKATYCPEGGFERRVAIKRIHTHLADNARFVESFRDEARLSARLLHPNIVSVLDFGSADGSYFMAMEYVDGLSLGAVVDRCLVHGTSIPPALIAQIGRQILDGLHFAHEVATDSDGQPLRVVHRDLSPNNVLISRAGQVKVVDFGIARAQREAEKVQTQHVAGNFAYMSPEQAQGQPFDARSDLFAVGCLIGEMLIRSPLFLRTNGSATLLAVIEAKVPSLAEHAPGVSPAWQRFLEKALARDPADRFANAAEMGAALDAIAATELDVEPTALRHFIAEVRHLQPPQHVESQGAFDRHDEVTAVSGVDVTAPTARPSAVKSLVGHRAPSEAPTRRLSGGARPAPATILSGPPGDDSSALSEAETKPLSAIHDHSRPPRRWRKAVGAGPDPLSRDDTIVDPVR
jgi:serine/threonine protein kinase